MQATELDRSAENRKIAEWLGWKHFIERAVFEGVDWMGIPPNEKTRRWVPDFYGDEAANALVLEKMPLVELDNRGQEWACSWMPLESAACGRFRHYFSAPDRKTAICAAALKLIEGEK